MKRLHQCDQCSGWAFRHSTEPCPNCEMPAQKHALRVVLFLALLLSTAPAWGAVLFYLLGVAVRGWGWIGEWLDIASEFGRIDAEVNGHSSVSFIGFAENLFGIGLSAPVALGWLLAGCTALLLVAFWWIRPPIDLALLIAITMPGILLLSLHAMSHDGAVVVLTAAVAVARWPRPRWLPWIVIIWLLGASQALIRQLGFSPGLPMLLVAFALGWLLINGPSTSGEATA